MATFEINGGTAAARTVKADKYGINDDYFHFTADEGRVLSISVTKVAWVERIED